MKARLNYSNSVNPSNSFSSRDFRRRTSNDDNIGPLTKIHEYSSSSTCKKCKCRKDNHFDCPKCFATIIGCACKLQYHRCPKKKALAENLRQWHAKTFMH